MYERLHYSFEFEIDKIFWNYWDSKKQCHVNVIRLQSVFLCSWLGEDFKYNSS